MTSRVAILHTSMVFINVEPMFKNLFGELLPDVEVIDFVDSDVLATVRRENGISEASAGRMVHLAQAAELAGADVIFSACSSLGPSMDIARKVVHVPIVKIDDAMADKAVRLATRVGVLATVPTTLPPTVALIEKHATNAGKRVTVLPKLCEGAFDVLMSGAADQHDRMVLDGARSLAPQVEILVLAQASMSRLAPALSEATGLEVLSSPRLAVEYVKDILEGTPSAAARSKGG